LLVVFNYSCPGRSAYRWNLRWRIRSRITKFSDDFDDGALTALGGHTGRRQKIDSLFLVERANHNLKLRIGENARQSKDSRSGAGDLSQPGHQKRIQRIRADSEIAPPISVCDGILSNRLSRGRIHERKIRRIHWCTVTRCATGTEDLAV